jgi:AcrR family transcriptional regulator
MLYHGDLRQALIDLAINAMRASGTNAFSLREAGKLAGVTPGAAYRHFASSAALLAEMRTLGFALLRKHLISAMKGLDSEKHFSALGLAYVTFAAKEPHLFALLFGPRKGGATNSPVEATPEGAFALSRHRIADRKEVGGSKVDPTDPTKLVSAVGLLLEGLSLESTKNLSASLLISLVLIIAAMLSMLKIGSFFRNVP